MEWPVPAQARPPGAACRGAFVYKAVAIPSDISYNIRSLPEFGHGMTCLCAPVRQFTLPSEFSGCRMARSSSQRPAAEAAQSFIRASFKEPYYPNYLSEDDSSDNSSDNGIIDPETNSLMTDLTGDDNGEVSALVSTGAIGETHV